MYSNDKPLPTLKKTLFNTNKRTTKSLYPYNEQCRTKPFYSQGYDFKIPNWKQKGKRMNPKQQLIPALKRKKKKKKNHNLFCCKRRNIPEQTSMEANQPSQTPWNPSSIHATSLAQQRTSQWRTKPYNRMLERSSCSSETNGFSFVTKQASVTNSWLVFWSLTQSPFVWNDVVSISCHVIR